MLRWSDFVLFVGSKNDDFMISLITSASLLWLRDKKVLLLEWLQFVHARRPIAHTAIMSARRYPNQSKKISPVWNYSAETTKEKIRGFNRKKKETKLTIWLKVEKKTRNPTSKWTFCSAVLVVCSQSERVGRGLIFTLEPFKLLLFRILKKLIWGIWSQASVGLASVSKFRFVLFESKLCSSFLHSWKHSLRNIVRKFPGSTQLFQNLYGDGSEAIGDFPFPVFFSVLKI